jgi:signal transduction histidine kinase
VDKERLWEGASALFCVWMLLIGVVFFLDFWIGVEAAFIASVLVGGVVSYGIVKYLLTPLAVTNKLLDRLVKDTLHELNAPLATIQANTQLLKQTHHDPSSTKRLERISQACLNLYTLYTQMEYYIKREIRLVKEESFDAKEALNVCIERSVELQGTITLTCKAQSTPVYVDRIGFEQCIMNLLSNAFKYNKPNGSVHVNLKDGILSIHDSGVGMDEHTRFRVFDRYYQGDPQSGGYGIGLHKVREFCDHYGIFIGLISTPGLGTTVTLKLDKILTKNQKDAI